jgi:hypothetical protein
VRSLPVPGADRRRRDRQNHLLRADAEQVAVIETNLTEARTGLDKVWSAVSGGWLTLTKKEDTP